MKVETHLHTVYGSPCGQVKPQKIVEEYLKTDFDAIVVTEHYNSWIVNSFYDKTLNPVDCFLKGYREVKKYANNTRLKVFLGMEINSVCDFGIMEYMIYGFDEKFLYDNERIYECDQRGLYNICRENEFFMYQTHPKREYITIGDLKFVDGLEVFNGHFSHNSHNAEAARLCEENKLIPMGGSDFHLLSGVGTGGIILQKEVSTERELVSEIKRNRHKIFETENR